MADPGSPTTLDPGPHGLEEWMRQVLVEWKRAAAGLDPDPVHDLRVALRRCRSMADSLACVDPERDWRRLRKIGRRIFRDLGELRDVQVLIEWTERLASPFDGVRRALLERLTLAENRLRLETRRALAEFERKEWRRLARKLPERARSIEEGGAVFESIALERWTEVQGLQERAISSRSGIAWHRLRIGVKRFRYVVENFLPAHATRWTEDVKHLQDLLGEVHDLDLLAAELRALRPLPAAAEREAWRARIAAERRLRLDEYRLLTSRGGLWKRFREELPDGERLRASVTQRLATWASFLDPDPAHTRRVEKLALDLHEALAEHFPAIFGGAEERSLLEAASIVHEVGRARGRGKKGRHKRAAAAVRNLGPFPGMDARRLELLVPIVRFHRGAEPRDDHAALAALDAPRRSTARALAGVLRLAEALDSDPDHPVLRVDVLREEDLVRIRATGLADDRRVAASVARATHLLASVLERPCFVHRVAPGPRLVAPGADDEDVEATS